MRNHVVLIIVLACALVGLLPGPAASTVDCYREIIEPTDEDLAKYEVHPWYPDYAKMSDAVAAAEAVKEKDEANFDAADDYDGSVEDEKTRKTGHAGSLESEIIIGLTDFIVDRAKAEAVQWFMDEMQKNLCQDEFRFYFQNTCTMQSQSKEMLPYLPGLVRAFKNDIEFLPATLLCKNFRTEKGYYLTSIVKNIMNGAPSENVLAGLAQNEKIQDACSNSRISSNQNTCDLYIAGLMAQTLIQSKGSPEWVGLAQSVNARLSSAGVKIAVGTIDAATEKQYILELVSALKDLDNQVKRINKNNHGRLQPGVLSGAAKKMTRDLLDIVYNPLAASITGFKNNNRNYIEPSINALSSGMSGQYSEALLDFNKILTEYYVVALNEISGKVKNKLIFIMSDSEGMEFKENDFGKDAAVTVCRDLYLKYYPGPAASCASFRDLNELLKRTDFYLKAPLAAIQKKESALVEMLFLLDDNEQHYPVNKIQAVKERITIILNRYLLEKINKDVPKSNYCYAPLLEAYEDAFNADNVKSLKQNRFMPVKARIEQTLETLRLTKGYVNEKRYFSSECSSRFETISKIVMASYDDSKIKLISPDNALQKYVPVIASLASAKNKEEIKNVLTETAASVGSWRLKQKKDSTVSLGAMLGIQASYERINGLSDVSYAGGLFAPMGFDFTFTSKWYCFGTGTCGFFLSALDVGTIASTKLNNDDHSFESNTENIKFSQVLSPGLYYHINIKNTPVVAGFGVSTVPLLRTEIVNGENKGRSGTRALVFLSMDIPMFFF